MTYNELKEKNPTMVLSKVAKRSDGRALKIGDSVKVGANYERDIIAFDDYYLPLSIDDMKKMGIKPEGTYHSENFTNTVFKCHYVRVKRAVLGYSHDLSCWDVNSIISINGKTVSALKTKEVYRAVEGDKMVRVPELCIK